jgi:hypothetical protein
MTANITCGLTRAELDAHPTWITLEGSCVALRPDGTKCNCPYSAHFAPQAIQPAAGSYPFTVYFIESNPIYIYIEYKIYIYNKTILQAYN